MARKTPPDFHLSRRERQIMDVIYTRGEATAREVLDTLPDPPGYSSVRKLLSLLVEKRVLHSRQSGRALIYRPVTPRPNAARNALRKIVDTFFEGSVSAAMTGLIDLDEDAVSKEEIERLKKRVRATRKRNTPKPR